MSDESKVPILAINSSSDEAWNFPNFLTSLAQVPFYLTHRFVALAITLFVFFVLAGWQGAAENGPIVTLNSLTSYNTMYGMKEYLDDFVKALKEDLIAEQGWSYWGLWLKANLLVLAWWVGSFSSVVAVSLLNVALLIAFALLVGYALALLVESFALGTPRWPLLEFLTTRKCIGLVPLNSSQVSFFNAGVGGSYLDHSLPYNSKRTLDRVKRWISDNARD